MNINEYKKYLKSVHNTLDDPSFNNQLRDRLSESPVCDMQEYKPDTTKDKSSHKPTTAPGDSLRPNSRTAEKMEKLKEEEEVEVSECVVEYFENYFGDNLNEDTSDEDIMEAVYDLIDLVEVVYNEAHTLLPDHPDVVKYWGGREKFDKLNARLGNKKRIDRKIPKVEVTRKPLKKKKKRGQLELFNAANQYFEAYFGQELNENISQNDIIKAVEDLAYLCEAVVDAVGLSESSAARKAETRKRGKYKYGTGPKPYSGSPKGAGAAKEDEVYRARAERGRGEMIGPDGKIVTQDTLKGGTLHNRKQGVTKNEYEALKKRYPGQIK
jgi:hypothetical protein